MITVAKLIEELKTYDPDSAVMASVSTTARAAQPGEDCYILKLFEDQHPFQMASKVFAQVTVDVPSVFLVIEPAKE